MTDRRTARAPHGLGPTRSELMIPAGFGPQPRRRGRNELVAKLKSLTNLRAVRDPKSPTGWTIELGPFPGWKDVPSW